jgi:hypothetical protein
MSSRIESGGWLTGRQAGGTMFVPAATHREGDAHALHAPVLVLNASYEPINVCAARRALVLVLKGKMDTSCTLPALPCGCPR